MKYKIIWMWKKKVIQLGLINKNGKNIYFDFIKKNDIYFQLLEAKIFEFKKNFC